MSKKIMYCQSILEKTTDTGKITIVTYIPQKYAIKDKILKLKNNDVWEDGWVVFGVGQAMEEDLLPNSYAEIKAHRNNTGDSQRK